MAAAISACVLFLPEGMLLEFYSSIYLSLHDFLSLPVCSLREYDGFPTMYSTLGVDISLGLMKYSHLRCDIQWEGMQ